METSITKLAIGGRVWRGVESSVLKGTQVLLLQFKGWKVDHMDGERASLSAEQYGAINAENIKTARGQTHCVAFCIGASFLPAFNKLARDSPTRTQHERVF